MERMTANRVRHIPVVDRDRLVGIVSIGDIVKHRLWEMEQEFRGIARLYPERLACAWRGRRRRNLVCASDRHSFQFPRSRARCSDC